MFKEFGIDAPNFGAVYTDNVMRDIRAMLGELRGEDGRLNFEPIYFNEQNKAQPCINLPKRETLILVSGMPCAPPIPFQLPAQMALELFEA
jgi:hypothetical protein